VLISVVLTVVVLNFHYRGPKKTRVPLWCRRIIINKIGKWLGFHFYTHEQLLSSSSSAKSLARRSPTRTSSNGDISRHEKPMKLNHLPNTSTTTTAAAIIEDNHDYKCLIHQFNNLINK
jgi:hypothetical protein